MTVDLDLLADYTEGLLGPADQERVAALVHDDREWAIALDALRAALPSVTSALADADAGPMPVAVLTSSLQAIAAERARTTQPTGSTQTTAKQIGAKRASTRPPAGRPATARTRRRMKPAVLAVVALVAIALAGLGFLINSVGRGDNHAESTAAAKVEPAAPQLSPAGSPAVTIVASGRNYTSVTLSMVFGTNVPSLTGPHSGMAGSETSSTPGPMTAHIPSALDRLQSPAALATCVGVVDDTLGGHATAVDYASFQGAPALIITLPDIDTVVAVGVDCGADGFGMDEIAQS